MAGKISLALNVLLIIAVIFLFARTTNTPSAKTTAEKAAEIASDSLQSENTGLKIAYVDADTLNKYYDFVKDATAELDREQAAAKKKVQGKMQDAQQRYQELSQKASTMTQTELQDAQQEMQDRQTDIQQYQTELANQFSDKQADLQKKLAENVKNYLKQFNDSANYDYVLSYADGGQVLFAKNGYNITKTVIAGLNKRYHEEQAEKKGGDTK